MGDELRRGRVDRVDMAKGLTMLLVIAGHSLFGVLRGAIYSFHMPLFFILSGMTFRFSGDMSHLWRRCRKAAVHLLLPAAVLIAANMVIEVLQAFSCGTGPDVSFWLDKAKTLLYCSGSRFYRDGQVIIGRIGIPWFLIVLFSARTLMDLLHLKLGRAFVPVCLALSVTGVYLGGQDIWLPLSADVVLSALFFLLCGQWLRRWDLDRGTWWKLILSACVWMAGLIVAWAMDVRYLEMASRSYPLFPLSHVTAVAGTAMVCCVSVWACRLWPSVKRAVLYCGEHSLVLLCVHTMDYLWEDLYASIHWRPIVCATARVAVDLAVFALVMLALRLWTACKLWTAGAAVKE